MKHAACIGGGGFKGAYSTSALKVMRSRGILPSAYFGSSVGALIGSFCAMHKFDLLDEIWQEVGRTQGANIFSPDLAYLKDGSVKVDLNKVERKVLSGFDLWDKVRLVSKKGRQNFIDRAVDNVSAIDSIIGNEPLHDLLKKHVKESDFVDDFKLTLVSLETGSLYSLSHKSFFSDNDLQLGILASSNMPVILKPIPEIKLKDGSIIRSAVDGGVRANTSIGLAFEYITDSFEWTVWGINHNSIYQPLNKEPKTLINQAGLTLDALMNQNFTRDIKMSTKINDWALKYPDFAKGENIVYAKLHNIECPVDQNFVNLLGSTLDARKEIIDKRIQIGYDVMSDFLAKNNYV